MFQAVSASRASIPETGEQQEAERIVQILVAVIADHPEVKEKAMRAIEANVVEETH